MQRRILLACLMCWNIGVAHLLASEQQAAHVRFDETMIVAWNQRGAVGVVFETPQPVDTGTGKPQMTYRWRTNDEQNSGQGTLLVDGSEQTLNVPHVLLKVKAATKRGTVFYDPAFVSVHPLNRSYYGVHDLGHRPRPPADLKQFVDPDRAVQDEFRKRKYQGQSTQPGYPRHPLSFKVRYFENGLVVADPNGVAVFEFLSSVDRTSDNEQRRGVKYRWRFVSADGNSTQFGEGEVWELYRDKKYVSKETLHHLEAGKVHIPWSINSLEAGWIYYDPAWQGVWFVAPKTASNLVSRETPSEALQQFRFGPRR